MKPKLMLYRGGDWTPQEPGKQRYVKDILRVGRWKHPETGQVVEVTQAGLEALAKQADEYRLTLDGEKVPFQDGHNFDAKKTLGWWERFFTHGDRLFGIVDVTDTDAAKKIDEGSIRSVSARIDGNVRDTRGKQYDEAFTHIAATPIAVVDGQFDFVKLSREADGFDLLIPVDLSGGEPKEKIMDPKKLAALLGLPEDADEAKILAAVKANGEGLKTATEKLKGFANLSAVDPADLKAHGLEVKDGKVVKLAAAPPADEPAYVKEMRARLEQSEKATALSRLQGVQAQIKEAVDAKRVPPSLVPAFAELASLNGEVQALCLSADGTTVQKGINALARVQEILKGLPSLGDLQLSQLSGAEIDEQKKLKDSASKKASEVLARTTGK